MAAPAPGSGPSSSSRPKPRRPPNGYNLFFRYQRERMKARERAQSAYAKMKKSSASRVQAANATSTIARMWETNKEQRDRFDVEAKECQENYRSEIEAWRAANSFDAYQVFLGNHEQQASFLPRFMVSADGLPVDSLPCSLASEGRVDSSMVARESQGGIAEELVQYLK